MTMSKTIYLYLKIHNTTGLKYLGKTVQENPISYRGSGKYWMRHIKKHGNDVTTKILYQTKDRLDMRQVGLYYSRIWDIVDSEKFANLIPESCDGVSMPGSLNPFFGKKHPKELQDKINKKLSELPKRGPISETTRNKMSKSHSGSNNAMYGKAHTKEWCENHSNKMKGSGNPRHGIIMSDEVKNNIRLGKGIIKPSKQEFIDIKKNHTNFVSLGNFLNVSRTTARNWNNSFGLLPF